MTALMISFSGGATAQQPRADGDSFLQQLQRTVDDALREDGGERAPERTQEAPTTGVEAAPAVERAQAESPGPATGAGAARPVAPLEPAALPPPLPAPMDAMTQPSRGAATENASPPGAEVAGDERADNERNEGTPPQAAARDMPPQGARAPARADDAPRHEQPGRWQAVLGGLAAGVALSALLALLGARAGTRLARAGAGLFALAALGLALIQGGNFLSGIMSEHATALCEALLTVGTGLWLAGMARLHERRSGQLTLATGGGLALVLAGMSWPLPQATTAASRALLVALAVMALAVAWRARHGSAGLLAALTLLGGGVALLTADGMAGFPPPAAQTAWLALAILLMTVATLRTPHGTIHAPGTGTTEDIATRATDAPRSTGTAPPAVEAVAADASPAASRMTHLAPATEDGALMTVDALHDPLTGLPNHLLLDDRIAQALGRARQGMGAPCLVVVDVDRHRFVLDTHGPAVADMLLVEMAARLRTLVGPEETLARLAGDQFAIIIDTARHGTALAFAQRLRELLHAPYFIDARQIEASVSMGIVDLVSVMQMSAREALRAAEIALFEARRGGTAQEAWFTPEMLGAHSRLAQMEQELRQALTRNELKVRYQPILQLGDGRRRLAGFEALVRWEHPRLGMIGPEQFIDVAEELGLIGEIGRIVLADAVRQLGIWQRTFRCERPLFVAVNISTREMVDPALVEEVRDLLAQEQAAASGLRLELTESLLLAAPERAEALMRRFAHMGVALACDDFGTGYSALARLKHLPFDAIKIDRSFLKDGEEADWNIVHAIVTLGHGLNMQVVAEGVEDAGQLEILEAMGCDMAQGWLLGKALKASDILNAMTRARRMAPLQGRLAALTAILVGEEVAGVNARALHAWFDGMENGGRENAEEDTLAGSRTATPPGDEGSGGHDIDNEAGDKADDDGGGNDINGGAAGSGDEVVDAQLSHDDEGDGEGDGKGDGEKDTDATRTSSRAAAAQ